MIFEVEPFLVLSYDMNIRLFAEEDEIVSDNSAPCGYEPAIAVPGGAHGWPFHRWARFGLVDETLKVQVAIIT